MRHGTCVSVYVCMCMLRGSAGLRCGGSEVYSGSCQHSSLNMLLPAGRTAGVTTSVKSTVGKLVDVVRRTYQPGLSLGLQFQAEVRLSAGLDGSLANLSWASLLCLA